MPLPEPTTVEEALEAAAQAQRQADKWWGVRTQRILQAHALGASMQTIAERLGRTRQAVSAVLHKEKTVDP